MCSGNRTAMDAKAPLVCDFWEDHGRKSQLLGFFLLCLHVLWTAVLGKLWLLPNTVVACNCV